MSTPANPRSDSVGRGGLRLPTKAPTPTNKSLSTKYKKPQAFQEVRDNLKKLLEAPRKSLKKHPVSAGTILSLQVEDEEDEKVTAYKEVKVSVVFNAINQISEAIERQESSEESRKGNQTVKEKIAELLGLTKNINNFTAEGLANHALKSFLIPHGMKHEFFSALKKIKSDLRNQAMAVERVDDPILPPAVKTADIVSVSPPISPRVASPAKATNPIPGKFIFPQAVNLTPRSAARSDRDNLEIIAKRIKNNPKLLPATEKCKDFNQLILRTALDGENVFQLTDVAPKSYDKPPQSYEFDKTVGIEFKISNDSFRILYEAPGHGNNILKFQRNINGEWKDNDLALPELLINLFDHLDSQEVQTASYRKRFLELGGKFPTKSAATSKTVPTEIALDSTENVSAITLPPGLVVVDSDKNKSSPKSSLPPINIISNSQPSKPVEEIVTSGHPAVSKTADPEAGTKVRRPMVRVDNFASLPTSEVDRVGTPRSKSQSSPAKFDSNNIAAIPEEGEEITTVSVSGNAHPTARSTTPPVSSSTTEAVGSVPSKTATPLVTARAQPAPSSPVVSDTKSTTVPSIASVANSARPSSPAPSRTIPPVESVTAPSMDLVSAVNNSSQPVSPPPSTTVPPVKSLIAPSTQPAASVNNSLQPSAPPPSQLSSKIDSAVAPTLEKLAASLLASSPPPSQTVPPVKSLAAPSTQPAASVTNSSQPVSPPPSQTTPEPESVAAPSISGQAVFSARSVQSPRFVDETIAPPLTPASDDEERLMDKRDLFIALAVENRNYLRQIDDGSKDLNFISGGYTYVIAVRDDEVRLFDDLGNEITDQNLEVKEIEDLLRSLNANLKEAVNRGEVVDDLHYKEYSADFARLNVGVWLEDYKQEIKEAPPGMISKATASTAQQTPSNSIHPLEAQVIIFDPVAVSDPEKIWANDKTDRRNKFRANEFYRKFKDPEARQDVIENVLLDILLVAANKTVKGRDLDEGDSLSHAEVLGAINFAKSEGGIRNKLKADASSYDKVSQDYYDNPQFVKYKKFSARFQKECEACGINSAREGAADLGLRLTFLPDSVLKKFEQNEEIFEQNSIKENVNQVAEGLKAGIKDKIKLPQQSQGR